MKNDSDFKDELLQEPKLVMIVTYDSAIAEVGGMEKMEKLNQDAKLKGYR
jgi:hypothetical protein